MSAPSQAQPSPWEKLLPSIRAAVSPRYEIVRLLGQGGMAGVFLADDPRLDRKVAIKVISPGLMMDPEMVKRFEHEARTQAKFQHANIVPIFDVGEKNDLHYLTMPHLPGRSLGEVLSDRVPLPIEVVQTWLYQVGSALGYAHRRGVVHRDIKPGNVLLDSDGKAMVTDFGIAKAADQPGLTQTGMLIGTPAYMSPEQCETGEVTAASDQYSLGILAFEMLTGKTPFSGSPLSIFTAHLNDPVPPVSELRTDCPMELSLAIARMLEKSPGDRWQSVDAAIAAGGAVPMPHGHPTQTTLATLSKRVARFSHPTPSAKLELGGEAALDVVPLDQNGNEIPGRSVSFVSDNPNALSVTDRGVLRALGRGTATIRVRSGATEESIQVAVVGRGERTASDAGAAWGGEVVTTDGPLTWVQPVVEPTPAPIDAPGAMTELLGAHPGEAATELATSPTGAGGLSATVVATGQPEGPAVRPPVSGSREEPSTPLWKRPAVLVGVAGVAAVVVAVLAFPWGGAGVATIDPPATDGSQVEGPVDTETPAVVVAAADSGFGSGDEDPEQDTGSSAPPAEVEAEPTTQLTNDPPPADQGTTTVATGSGGESPDEVTRTEDPPESAEPTPAVELPPPAPATLAIIGTLPEDAVVTVTGDSIGTIQLEDLIVQLQPGRYQLVASAPGYADASIEMDLAEYDAKTWDPGLQPASGAGPALQGGDAVEEIQIAIDGFISAFRARRVDRVVALLPADSRDGFRAFMGMDVSRWDVTSGFEDIGDPTVVGSEAEVDFSFTLRTRDVNSGDRTQQLSFSASLSNDGGRWQLVSVRPR